MPNPGGGNQFGSYQLQPPYGDVARQTQLTREAPISGAPVSAHALQTPRRSSRQARRGAPAQSQPQEQQAPAGAPVNTTVAQPMAAAAAWQLITRVDGVSPLVQELAARAQQEAQRG